MLKKIYDISPIFLQNLLISIKGKQLEKERYNKHYYQEFKLLKNNEDSHLLQKEKLNQFIKYVKNNSTFYNKKLSSLEPPINIEELKNIEVLHKEDIRKNLESIITTNKNLIPLQTGGTTGKSLLVYSNPIDMSKRIAFLDYFKSLHGVEKGMRRASFTGRSVMSDKQKRKIFWRYNKPLNQKLFSSFHADGENLKYYIRELNKFKPQSIDGFTNVIYRIANYININKIQLEFTPLAIFPTAESLSNPMKETIEKAFGCPVRNQYASSEGSPFITECTKGKLHLNIQTGVFELENIEEDIYKLYVTSFFTSTTPLIRYDIGDAVKMTGQTCTCGSDCEVVDEIIGRSNDYLVSRERGRVDAVHLSTIIREASRKIIESQIIQNNLDEIIFKLVIEPGVDIKEIEQSLYEPFISRFGSKTSYSVVQVDELEKTDAGKTRFIINNLN